MDKIQGKHFSITDPQGVNTVIYRVNKTPRELLQEYPKFTVQRLEYAEELNGNLKKKTFFVVIETTWFSIITKMALCIYLYV